MMKINRSLQVNILKGEPLEFSKLVHCEWWVMDGWEEVSGMTPRSRVRAIR